MPVFQIPVISSSHIAAACGHIVVVHLLSHLAVHVPWHCLRDWFHGEVVKTELSSSEDFYSVQKTPKKTLAWQINRANFKAVSS